MRCIHAPSPGRGAAPPPFLCISFPLVTAYTMSFLSPRTPCLFPLAAYTIFFLVVAYPIFYLLPHTPLHPSPPTHSLRIPYNPGSGTRAGPGRRVLPAGAAVLWACEPGAGKMPVGWAAELAGSGPMPRRAEQSRRASAHLGSRCARPSAGGTRGRGARAAAYLQLGGKVVNGGYVEQACLGRVTDALKGVHARGAEAGALPAGGARQLRATATAPGRGGGGGEGLR